MICEARIKYIWCYKFFILVRWENKCNSKTKKDEI